MIYPDALASVVHSWAELETETKMKKFRPGSRALYQDGVEEKNDVGSKNVLWGS